MKALPVQSEYQTYEVMENQLTEASPVGKRSSGAGRSI
jgi:hypothetical protein